MRVLIQAVRLAAFATSLCMGFSQSEAAPAPASQAKPTAKKGVAAPTAAASAPSAPCPGPEKLGSVLVTSATVPPLLGQDEFRQMLSGSFGPQFAEWVSDSFGPGHDPKTHQVHAQLRHEIVLEIDHLDDLLARAKCVGPQKHLVLFLDGRPVPGLEPYPATDPVQRKLRFTLERRELTDSSREVWTHVLGRATFTARPVPVSVGMDDEYPVRSQQVLELDVIPKGWFWLWTVIFVGLLVSCWILAVKSDLLRDPGPAPQSLARKPYSLARMQLAFWFFLILASYLFIGIVTGDYATTITGTVLALMGISGGTAIGSSLLDTSATKGAQAQKAAPLAPVVPAVPPAAADPADPAVPAVPQATQAQALAPVVPRPATKGHWWIDILSDANGVNFHRFQMAAWTLVLGIVFVQDVYRGLAMPEFNATLLGLLGISAGTYLGLKSTSE
jgi:hypothetical protein